jgi:nitrogenase-associated protein
MAVVRFYQKPGCATNARQIQALQQAGHSVIAKNLLTEPWTQQDLRGFFGDTPVASWFNRASPRVKCGEIDPNTSDVATTLALMLADPLLIRRPLIEASGSRCAGFDREPVIALLGDRRDMGLQACAREKSGGPCLPPARAASSDAGD